MKPTAWIQSYPAQAALRTYALSLSLSLGPSLLPFLTALVITPKSSHRTRFKSLFRVLHRELGIDGFAFAMMLSIGGGAALSEFWRVCIDASKQPDSLQDPHRKFLPHLSPKRTFISNMFSSTFGFLLLQAGRRRAYRLRRQPSSPIVTSPMPTSTSSVRISDTLDLTLLLLVRAVDSLVQIFLRTGVPAKDDEDNASLDINVLKKRIAEENASSLTSRIDALVFWICSSRIMWCFFYEPERLPRSYVKWIAALANLDSRVIQALKLLRSGHWSYINGSAAHSTVLTGFSQELGHSTSWGDPVLLPAYGGAVADAAWKVLGVKNRRGVGGLPCELVHGSVSSIFGLEGSCTANTSIRGAVAFLEAVAIYLPAHFFPVLLARPKTLLQPHRVLSTVLGVLRSASFLSSFVALYWSAVCITRTTVFARLMPWISHDFWDGPLGCIFAGSLLCGSSIWIENGRRRGEMALYVLPRAIRACLPDVHLRNNSTIARFTERLVFILSFATLVTAATHRPDTLRGLSRWTLSFIFNGPNGGLWKRKRRGPGPTDTPIAPTDLVPSKQ